MDITQYESLTGASVPTNLQTRYTAQINRVQKRFETMLGYTLNPTNIYNELGKNITINPCSNFPTSYDNIVLDPADPVQGVVKIFPYNLNDQYFMVDPFTKIHSCKLVTMVDSRNYATIHTFAHPNPTFSIDNNSGVGKYIGRCPEWFMPYGCLCDKCVFVAVDADWISEWPDDINYIMCDMIDYYVDEQYKIGSESVDGHNVSYKIVAPETISTNLKTIKQYMGPYGTLADPVPTL